MIDDPICRRCGERPRVGGRLTCEVCFLEENPEGTTVVEMGTGNEIGRLQNEIERLRTQQLIYEEGLQLWAAKEEEFKAQIHKANLGIIAERAERDNRVVEMSNQLDELRARVAALSAEKESLKRKSAVDDIAFASMNKTAVDAEMELAAVSARLAQVTSALDLIGKNWKGLLEVVRGNLQSKSPAFYGTESYTRIIVEQLQLVQSTEAGGGEPPTP